MDSDLVPMKGNMGVSCSSHVIGFVFPIYFWGIPHLVREFLLNIKILSENPYLFAVSSRGAASGGTFGMVNEALAKTDLSLSYGKSIRSVSNYIVEYDIKQKSIEKNWLGLN